MSVPPWRLKPAYTRVEPKRINGTVISGGSVQHHGPGLIPQQPAPPAPPSTKDLGAHGTAWPDSLRRFVGRCFDQVEAQDRPVMEAQLRALITSAFETKTTWVIEWDQQTLPIIKQRQDEKEIKDRKDREKRERELAKESKASKRKAKLAAKEASLAESKRRIDLNESQERRDKRQKRFEREKAGRTTGSEDFNSVPTEYNPDEPIIGRSTRLEKNYLRLTSAPDPSTIRPLYILKQTLELLKSKWKSEQNYPYICDQFKSLRQDLTVQRIQNEFTVSVYEIHGRIALEKADLGEYNQCQAQLKTLYDMGIKGCDKEFLAYRILYLIHTQNRAEIAEILIHNESITDPSILHALDVGATISTGNYHKLFKLYNEAPNMGAYVMDSFINRERLTAFSTICRAYRPDVETKFLAEELGFVENDELDEFLEKYQAKKYVNENRLLTKEAWPYIEAAKQAAYKKVDIKGQI